MDAPLSSARHNQEPQQHEKRRDKERKRDRERRRRERLRLLSRCLRSFSRRFSCCCGSWLCLALLSRASIVDLQSFRS